MFGREANMKHNLLASERPKYMGTDESMINLELMNKLYLVVAHNLHEARKARDRNCSRNIPRDVDILKLGDNMLVRDHTSKVFQPKYKDFCITRFLGKNQIEVKDNHGHTMKVHRRDVKKIPMTDKISQIYEEEQINKTRNGRKLVPENKIPNLHWNLEKQETVQKEEIQETQVANRLNRMQKVIIYIIIFIHSYILQIQDTVCKYARSVMETTQNTVGTIKGISHSSWIKFQKEMQTIHELLHAHRENFENRSYRLHNSHNDNITTQ